MQWRNMLVDLTTERHCRSVPIAPRAPARQMTCSV